MLQKAPLEVGSIHFKAQLDKVVNFYFRKMCRFLCSTRWNQANQVKQPVQLPATTTTTTATTVTATTTVTRAIAIETTKTATNVTILSDNEANRCELQLRDAGVGAVVTRRWRRWCWCWRWREGRLWVGGVDAARGGCWLDVEVVCLWLGMRLGRFVACSGLQHKSQASACYNHSPHTLIPFPHPFSVTNL